MVDKLWQDVFKKDAKEVYNFIINVIFQTKQIGDTISLEGIYRCLNRTVLFLLSKQDSVKMRPIFITEVLKQLLSHRSVLFGRENTEIEFFGCLTFCLLNLAEGTNVPLVMGCKPTYLEQKESREFTYQDQNNLKITANKVWEELYFNKKSAIEEVSKVSFPYSNRSPSLESVRDLLRESAGKLWFQYLEMEKKACYQRIPAWEIHTHIQSRIQKVAGGLTGGLKRLTSVSGPVKVRKEEEVQIRNSNISFAEVEVAVQNHLMIVSDVVDQHNSQRNQTQHHMLTYSEEEWSKSEGELMRERGIWGPEFEDPLIKWQLDMTEGPFRMRKRMVRDSTFYLRYPHRKTKSEDKLIKYRKPTSFDSMLWYEKEDQQIDLEYDDCDIAVTDKSVPLTIEEQIKELKFKGVKTITDDQTLSLDESEEQICGKEEEDKSESVNAIAMEEFSFAYQTVMRLLENGEKIMTMFRCARIKGLDTVEGLLLFGKEHFYIIDGFTIVNQREVHDIDFIPDNLYEPIIPSVPGQLAKIKPKREVFKLAYGEVKEVHQRRYLLQPIAIEVFSKIGHNYLLAFQRQNRGKVYQKYCQLSSVVIDNAAHSVAGQRRTASVEQSNGIFSSLIGETSVTQRWVRGEISNFQYLMSLNTLAGRSYNDLMQYPVFPWVLSSYTSEELDLSNPKTFRDFSKPMGAQTDHRLEQYKKRFQDWDDAGTDSPPYHYGTHYSSAMIVSSYLVRLEPFTQHFLHLQGGYFDLPDRMFHSIAEAWESSSRNNMADVRELIPEFFYLPEFLENKNKFDFGTKQNGETLNDVVLPPWAKGDTREFIRVHREALESDYVSANLHKWIDLIFGFRQQGEAAEECHNTFHHLFYEGNVDIFSIEDPLQRNATIGFINNFGQIPKQLFKKPHPAKKFNQLGNNGVEISGASLNSKIFFHNLKNLCPSTAPIKQLKGPVGEIYSSEKMVYAVEQNKVLVPEHPNRYLAWGFSDQSFRLGNYDSDKPIYICEPDYLVGEVLTCICPNSRLVLTAGTSTVVCVWIYNLKLKQLQLKHSLYGHTDAVTCLAASLVWGVAVSGSRDKTVIIWDISKYDYVKTLSIHSGPVAAVDINELNGNIVSCAGSWLYVWDINGMAIASVDTALSSVETTQMGQILCVTQSQLNEWDRENVVITGGKDGIVRMWSVDYIEISEREYKISNEVRTKAEPSLADHLSDMFARIEFNEGKSKGRSKNDTPSNKEEAFRDESESIQQFKQNDQQPFVESLDIKKGLKDGMKLSAFIYLTHQGIYISNQRFFLDCMLYRNICV